MGISRREVLMGAAALGLAGCAPTLRRARELQPTAPIRPVDGASLSVRKLNRMGYGPTPEEVARVEEIGWEAYVDEQLAATRAEPAELEAMLRQLDIHSFGAVDLRALPEHEVIRQLHQATLLRTIYSSNQLRERMVEFWSDHFNIDIKKAYGTFYLSKDLNQNLRSQALGTFPKLLSQSAHGPSMLAYLDNKQNRKGGVNENYGRELLELHSMGVRSGYTQKDVREVAKCFTGWTVEDRFLRAGGTFRFDPERHEPGARLVLGHRIAADLGKGQGDRVLDILGAHPATGQHIARKLCALFLGEHGPEVTPEVARAYHTSNGDIKAMMRVILLHPKFGAEDARLPKRPLDFVAGSMRALGSATSCVGLIEPLEKMRQPLYQWPMPDGYSMRASAWTGSLLERWNFALAFAFGQLPDLDFSIETLAERLSLPAAEAVNYVLFGQRGKALHSDPRRHLALALGSPEFLWR